VIIIPRKWTNSKGNSIFVDKSKDRRLDKLRRELKEKERQEKEAKKRR